MPTITDTITTPDGNVPRHARHSGGRRSVARRRACIRTPGAGVPSSTRWPRRLAGYGYAVLVPDIYYRSGDWAPFDINTAFGDPDERTRLMSMMGGITPDMMAADAAAFFDYLESRPEVSGSAFGTTGYCMGGRTSLVVAGRVPDRVAAAMSFHGGGLASDDPGSPHLLADQIEAAVYVGGAENDASFTPEAAETLDKALTAAGVEHTIEWYAAAHGFAVAGPRRRLRSRLPPSGTGTRWRRFFGAKLG